MYIKKEIDLISYDTLHITHTFNSYQESEDYIDFIKSKLSNKSYGYNEHTESHYIKGNILNLSITISNSKLKVKGSLCKSYHGNNLNSMTRSQIESHLKNLSKELELPLLDADVTRIDIASCFTVNNKPESYFDILGDGGVYKRGKFKDSLYYQTTNKEMVFYNKRKEINSQHKLVKVERKNLLRYELRLIDDLTSQFNMASVKVKDLYEVEFFNNMVELYVNEYKKIYKNRLLTSTVNNLTGNEGIYYLTSALIKQHNEDVLQALTKTIFDKFKSSTERYRFKQKLKNLKHLAIESELVTELNDKIAEAKNNSLTPNSYDILEEAV